MRIRFTPRALRNLEEIREDLEQRSPRGARNVLRAIEDAVRFIGEHPHGAEQTNEPSVRMKVVLRHRYKVFYRIKDGVVQIVHIRHTSRRPWAPEDDFPTDQ